MQDPFDAHRNTSGGMKLGTFLIFVVCVIAGLYLLSEADLSYGPEPSPSATVSPR